jgi:hypothetical protein
VHKTDDEKSWMTAVAFAEEGEWETARHLTPDPRPGRLRAAAERHLVAAAFAEEGLPEEARRLVGAARAPEPEATLEALLAAHGVRMFCGVLSPAALAPR